MYSSLKEITMSAGVAESMPDWHFNGLHLLLLSQEMISETIYISFVIKLCPCSTCAHLSEIIQRSQAIAEGEVFHLCDILAP